jgi:AcrR family transcriptional regulator
MTHTSMISLGETPDPAPSGGASAAPRPTAGTRARAGNAMARTRSAVLAGALRAVERSGTRRTTMSEVAALGGVAKATVYNHFRTKADVLAGLVESEVEALGAECVQRAEQSAGRDGLADAVEHAAVRISEHRALRSVVSSEPEVLAGLLVPGDAGAWVLARAATATVLRATGRADEPVSIDTVLRVVASHAAWPSGRAAAGAVAEALARGLPPQAVESEEPVDVRGAAAAAEASGPEAAASAPSDAGGLEPLPGAATGLGWPG